MTEYPRENPDLDISPAMGVMFLHKNDSRQVRRVAGIVRAVNGKRALVTTVGQAAENIEVWFSTDDLYERHELTNIPLTDMYMTEAEVRFMFSSFGVEGSCGCDGAFDDGCPLCTNEKRVAWLQDIRKANRTHR